MSLVVHTVALLVRYVHRLVDSFTLLVSASKRIGFSRTNREVFPLRINRHSWEKQPINGKETLHRKHLRTRNP